MFKVIKIKINKGEQFSISIEKVLDRKTISKTYLKSQEAHEARCAAFEKIDIELV